MKMQKCLAMLFAAAVLQALPTQGQSLFDVKFRAKCTTDNNGRTTTLRERDLINRCIAGTDFATNDIRNLSLVYNADADAIQVVDNNGDFVCDVFIFQGGTVSTDNRKLTRFTFMFSPDQAESIGSAVITEKETNNPERAKIKGDLQFTLPVLDGTDGDGTDGDGSDTNGTADVTGTFVQAPALASATPGEVCTGTFKANRAFQPRTAAGQPQGGNVSRDVRFLQNAAEADLHEIQMGQLAIVNTTDPDVTAFGQQLIDDHSASLEQISELAAARNVDLPTEPNASHQRILDRLSVLQEGTFDRAFTRQSVADHNRSIDLYRSQVNRTNDDEIRAFAEATLPILEAHRVTARQLQSQVQNNTNVPTTGDNTEDTSGDNTQPGDNSNL